MQPLHLHPFYSLTATRDTIYNFFMGSALKSLKLFCTKIDFNLSFRWQFCTSVMACVKLRSDEFILFIHVRAINILRHLDYEHINCLWNGSWVRWSNFWHPLPSTYASPEGVSLSILRTEAWGCLHKTQAVWWTVTQSLPAVSAVQGDCERV